MPQDTPDASVVPADRPRSDWDAWGTQPARLPAGAKALVAALLPGKAHPVPRRPAPTLTTSRLNEDDLSALATVVGRPNATTDDAVRMMHLGGKSTPDLLARRLGELQTAPDAVVSPSTHSETLAVLAVCDERGIAVVPFGGGTSVVGGVRARRGRTLERDRARPRSHGAPPDARRDLAAGHLRRRHHRPAGRGAARRARLHDRPLPAELRVRLARRVRGDAIERPGLARLRAIRRHRPCPAGGDSGRRAPARARPGERRGSRSARAVPRLRGRLRGAHRGHRPRSPAPRGDRVRRVDLRRLRLRCRRLPRS